MAIGLKDLVDGRQYGLVTVLDAAQRLKEVGKVVTLCEGRELRGVVKANVDETANAVIFQCTEEG